MTLRFLGVLDRYVLKQWLLIFLLSAIGVPAVAVIIDLSEQFGKLSERGIPVGQILYGQMFMFPSKTAMLVPAAVLFATVFTLNGMGRHSELTAVQGGGISFYRLIAPMLILATLAVPADYELQDLAGYSTRRQKEIHHIESSAADLSRFSFPYAAPDGWIWAISEMYRKPDRATGLIGEGPRNPAGNHWAITADSALWTNSRGWELRRGATFLQADTAVLAVLQYQGMRTTAFDAQPGALMQSDKRAEEMTTSELRRYLKQLTASGAAGGTLSVELPLKYAVPVACLIVALFGAPMAITNARAGAAVGLAIALGTTLVYLTGTQIMKAVGAKELVSPIVAAWSMNAVFLVLAVILLARVRS